MHISVFCGASLPHSEQITEAARQLGRAIGNSMANAKQDFDGLAKTKHLKDVWSQGVPVCSFLKDVKV